MAKKNVEETTVEMPAEITAEVAEAPAEAIDPSVVEDGYKGPVVTIQSLVPGFIAVSTLYQASPASFPMGLDVLAGLGNIGKVVEVAPKTAEKPAELVRIVSGEQLIALLAGVPALKERFAETVQSRVDAVVNGEEYQKALNAYDELLNAVEDARASLYGMLIEGVKPFDVTKFVSGYFNPAEPKVKSSTTAAQSTGTVRHRSPDSAKWSLPEYKATWNGEEVTLANNGGTWSVVSASKGYVESSDDGSISAEGRSPNEAWRNFLSIRGRATSVSTPRQFRAAEVEAAAGV